MIAVCLLGVGWLIAMVAVVTDKGRIKVTLDGPALAGKVDGPMPDEANAPKATADREAKGPEPATKGAVGSPPGLIEGPSATLMDKQPVSPASIPAPELVAFYNFNDASATDRSGNGHHGIFSTKPPQFTPARLPGRRAEL